jgi:hypothetical protein
MLFHHLLLILMHFVLFRVNEIVLSFCISSVFHDGAAHRSMHIFVVSRATAAQRRKYLSKRIGVKTIFRIKMLFRIKCIIFLQRIGVKTILLSFWDQTISRGLTTAISSCSISRMPCSGFPLPLCLAETLDQLSNHL